VAKLILSGKDESRDFAAEYFGFQSPGSAEWEGVRQ
jgi:hypothetical protein